MMKKNIVVIKNINEYINSDIDDSLLKDSVVVYCRVSSLSQIEGNSLDVQQNKGVEFFEKKKDLDFENIIVIREEGKSGDDFDKESLVGRELLGLIISKIEKGYIKDLWVIDSSRLSRSSELSGILYKIFSENSIRYYINNELKNLEDLDSGLLLKILSVFDEYENFKRDNKFRIGKIEHLKLNKWKGGKINFGYRIGDNSEILKDEVNSKIVKHLFDLYNKTESLESLKIYLNTKNILPPTSNKKMWNNNTLKNLLTNKIYIGELDIEVKLLKNRSKEYCREKGKIINIKQNTPKIITKKLFDDVGKKIEKNNRKTKSDNRVKYNYLLRGLVYCGSCGEKMSINSNKSQNKKVYYSSKGFTKQINIDVVEHLVWNEVLRCFKESYRIKEEFRKESLEVVYKERETPKNEIEKNKKSIKHYLKNIKKLENKLVELLRKNLTLNLSEKDYLSLEKSVKDEIEINRNKILEVEKRIEIINNGIEWYNWLDKFDELYDEIKNYTSFKQRQKFITKYVKKVNVDWDKNTNTHTLTITFNLNIVRDERIRKEKYVFEVIDGENVSVINDINHNKINKLLKKKNSKKLVERNHSTVTDLFRTTNYYTKNSIIKSVNKINVSFDLIIISSKLTKTSHYTSYQQKLYRLIKFLKEERGIGYRRISHILYDKGYRSVRTKSILQNNYIYSIYKKGKIREERINRDFEQKINNINYSISNL
jgi:site-specific DNA recombinase